MSDETGIAFLRLILPDQGPYVAWIKETKENVFSATIGELWSIIKATDERGSTAYHACAGFREARHDPPGTLPKERRFGRTKHNVFAAKSLWLDVDAGKGKPYSHASAVRAAVLAFSRQTGLPAPLFVESGFGLHNYWPLKQALDRATWGRYAAGLKALCDRHGLKVDRSRTTDISSVLRTPGTHNRKEGIRTVKCSELVGPFDLDQFAILLSAQAEVPPKQASVQAAPWPLPGYLSSAIRSPLADSPAAGLNNNEPSYGVTIAERCEQVRSLRDSRGNISEPLWYAAIGVLAFAQDGERLAHDWSSGDKRYTREETQERLERARMFGPTTCAHFHKHNPAVCERCPVWEKIKTPIVLGRPDARHALETNRAENVGQNTTYPLRWHGDDETAVQRNWLVKNCLPRTGAGLISGQWGTAKTFVAVDLAGAVMIGGKFAGRAVKRKGGVLFLAAEGASEIPIRLYGLATTNLLPLTGKLPFAWAEGCPTLMERGAIDKLMLIAKQAADRMNAEFGVELALIIIDTMSAAAAFKDENASAEGQLAMNLLNELSKRTGALVIACDHFGKATETGTRGTSAKEASADVVLACLADKTPAGTVTNLRIAIRKLRGGGTGAETAFMLKPIDVGVDEDGDPITTCTVEWSTVTVGPPQGEIKGPRWPKSAERFRSALITATNTLGSSQKPFADRPVVSAVDLEQVREEFEKRYPLDGTDRAKQLSKRRQAFKRAREAAESRGLIGGREIDGKFMVWLVNAADLAAGIPSSPARGGQSSVTNVTPP